MDPTTPILLEDIRASVRTDHAVHKVIDAVDFRMVAGVQGAEAFSGQVTAFGQGREHGRHTSNEDRR